jgi:hypothetical protein
VTRNSSGILQSVSVLYLNLNRQDLKGLDFEASYHTNLGAESSLDLRGLATYHQADQQRGADAGHDHAGQPGWRQRPQRGAILGG